MKPHEFRKMAEEHRKDILRSTGMTIEQYNQLMFDIGFEFLDIECAGDQWNINAMSKEPMFWQWWKNVWYQRESFFWAWISLEEIAGTREEYEHHMSVEMFDRHCTSLIYRESYTNMIKKLSRKYHGEINV